MRRVSVDHELLRRAVADPEVLHWHTWAALAPGPSLVVLGAVHGNEVCGAHAIVRAIDDLTHGRLRLLRGRLTLVPVANPLAFAQATREGERNLNRRFLPQPEPQDYEDRITRQLAPLLAQHEVLLDLHSFHTPGDPFAMVGPRNNSGAREPFARAAEEMALARALGAQQVVEGWLEVYDRAAGLRGELPDDEGIGTNEYMRSQGGYAVTIVCGQHEDPEAIDVATRVIVGFYVSLEAPSSTSVALCLTQAVLPKESWLAQRGLDCSWPVWGLPRALHSDNGADFTAAALRRGCAMHGIELILRPLARPHFGGQQAPHKWQPCSPTASASKSPRTYWARCSPTGLKRRSRRGMPQTPIPAVWPRSRPSSANCAPCAMTLTPAMLRKSSP